MKSVVSAFLACALSLTVAMPAPVQAAGPDISAEAKRQALSMAAARDARSAALVKQYEDVDVIAVTGLPLPLSAAQAAHGRKESQRLRTFMALTTAEIVRADAEGRTFVKSLNLDAATTAQAMSAITTKMKLALDAHGATEQASRNVSNKIEAYIAWGAALKGTDFANGRSGALVPSAQVQKDALFASMRQLGAAAQVTAQQTEAVADKMIDKEEAAKKALRRSLSR